MSADAPYISFVATARNDDHGGDLLRRMRIFLGALLEQAKRHGLSAELILVEWNPPADRPRLHEALRPWPTARGFCSVRIIEVPPEVHARFHNSDKLPLFQMIAKNVGIRRAKGRFILATNVDLLFSEQLISFLASERLLPGLMYRIDRYDVSSDVPAEAPVEDQLDYCTHNVIRVNRRDGTFDKDALRWGRLMLPRLAIRMASRSLIQLLANVRRHIVQSLSTCATVLTVSCKHLLSSLSARTTAALARRTFGKVLGVEYQLLASQARFLDRTARLIVDGATHLSRSVAYRLHSPYPRLHTNGCGDFTLMAREQWFALGGYPELEMFSFNLDSLLCHMAYNSRVPESVLRDPMRIYHIEHKSGWTPRTDLDMKERLRVSGIPMLDFPQFESLATRMRKEKRPIVFNGDNWGLGPENLDEMRV